MPLVEVAWKRSDGNQTAVERVGGDFSGERPGSDRILAGRDLGFGASKCAPWSYRKLLYIHVPQKMSEKHILFIGECPGMKKALWDEYEAARAWFKGVVCSSFTPGTPDRFARVS